MFLYLNSDIFNNIFSFLDEKDITKVSLINQYFNDLCLKILYQKLTQKYFQKNTILKNHNLDKVEFKNKIECHTKHYSNDTTSVCDKCGIKICDYCFHDYEIYICDYCGFLACLDCREKYKIKYGKELFVEYNDLKCISCC